MKKGKTGTRFAFLFFVESLPSPSFSF